ncbi:ABC transporter ATP-binding protein [Hyphomonas sp.]|uniref:ABC transporter ATP-binding protein n=1 Tax=Hyphomonas sp. TaxID=87 RepID=UPI0025BFB45F|nr:ABC transporter ATP-binding protein [Hyphomonas sp.]
MHFWPHRAWFIGGTALALLTALWGIGYVAALDYVGNSLQAQMTGDAGGAPTGWIWSGIAAIIVLTAGRSLSMYGMTLLNNTGVQRGLVSVQTVQYDALIDGDYARVAADASGSFVSRFISDVISIREAALRFANNFTKSLATVIGVLIWLFWKDWQLALIIAVVYPLALGPVVSLGNSVRKRAKRSAEQTGEVTSLLSEGFQSARVVKAFGLERWQKARAEKGFAERSSLFLKVLSKRAGVDPVLEVFGGFALAALLGVVAWRISQGQNTLGDLLGVIGAVAVAAPEVRALGSISAVAQEGAAAADRVFEIVDAKPKVADRPGALGIETARGEIEFSDVHFAYPDGTQALKGLSFTARPGETVAFVGASGAGKSTVFNLLMRLYDADGGSVRLDGLDVRDVTGASLRGQMALVAQDAALFDDTIANNIALGKPGATRAAVEKAAMAANAHVFIQAMPGGYDAPAGEMGRNLSGGQRQRVALARAILRGAPILLLDEATSALDAESEAKVQEALSQFARGRTVLIIAHRLSTVRAADRIIVMEDGRAVEEGTHDALMARGGTYNRLVELQLS